MRDVTDPIRIQITKRYSFFHKENFAAAHNETPLVWRLITVNQVADPSPTAKDKKGWEIVWQD